MTSTVLNKRITEINDQLNLPNFKNKQIGKLKLDANFDDVYDIQSKIIKAQIADSSIHLSTISLTSNLAFDLRKN